MVPKETTWNNRWREWRKAKDFPIPWSRWQANGATDIMRHSFITHALPSIYDGNEAKCARHCGTSVQQIHDEYDGVVDEADAWPYFQIRPSEKAV